MDAIPDLADRIEAAVVGALAGEHAAGVAAGAADLLGVAESVAASGGFDEVDLRHRGLERPSKAGTAGLLMRALPFGLVSPLDRPRIRRDAYRCITLGGGDEGIAVAGVASAMLIADLLRFDLGTALVRVRQSLLEDAPLALLQRLSELDDEAAPVGPHPEDGAPALSTDPSVALQWAITALARADSLQGVLAAAAHAPSTSLTLAGGLEGARHGGASITGVDRVNLPHGDRAVLIAHRLAERAVPSETIGA